MMWMISFMKSSLRNINQYNDTDIIPPAKITTVFGITSMSDIT